MDTKEPDILSRLKEAVRTFGQKTVVILGDVLVDEHIYGVTRRISREAPVLILEETHRDISLGGAGNALMNVVSLGANATLCSVIGDDQEGAALLALIKTKSLSEEGIFVSKNFLTPRLSRIWAGSKHTSKQQVIRLDKVNKSVLSQKDFCLLIKKLKSKLFDGIDGLIISDYGHGLVSRERAHILLEAVRDVNIPVFVDSRRNMLLFKGAHYFTPSESELEEVAELSLNGDGGVLIKVGQMCMDKLGKKTKAIVVTRGSLGMAVFEPGVKETLFPVFGETDVTDVTGAGDTVMAVFALSILVGLKPKEAAYVANIAGGMVVMKRGCAQIVQDELIEGLVNASEYGPYLAD